MASPLKTTTFTVHASQEQAVRWNRAAAGDGHRATGSWMALAVDAHLKARARAGQPVNLCWCLGRFKVRLMDGRTVEVRGMVSPPFGTFQGDIRGRSDNHPRSLVYLTTGHIIATLRTARQCRRLASELTPALLKGDLPEPSAVVEKARREAK